MTAYLSQEDFFDSYFDQFGAGIEPSAENIELVRAFLFEKWKERAIEIGYPVDQLPVDLTDSCKFTSLFGSVVFGADIGGNWSHVHNLVDGSILDINAEASDVKDNEDWIYDHDACFINSHDFRESMITCIPRVERWLEEFTRVYVAHCKADGVSQQR